MNVKIKLALAVILIAIAPVIILNSAFSSNIKKAYISLMATNTKNIISNQSENINFYFEDISSSTREIASSESMRRYTQESNEAGFTMSDDNEDYERITARINNMITYDSSLKKIMVINNSGLIIASTDDSDVGETMTNYNGFFFLATENNGISSFNMSGEKDNNMPVFFVAKSILSYDNERQGIVYELYDTEYIQKLMNNAQLDKYTVIALMDKSGNIFEYPFKTVKSYTENKTYSGANDFLRDIINPSNNGKFGDSYDFADGKNKRTVFKADVSHCGWTMLALTDRYSFEKQVRESNRFMRNISTGIVVLVCVGALVFIHFFTKPIYEILQISRQKENGKSDIQFRVRGSDEFSRIGRTFNKIMDDIYESEQRYRTIAEMSNNIIFEINLKKNTVFVSKNFDKKFSFRAKDDTIEESFLYKMRIHKDDHDRFANDVERILGSSNSIQGEYRAKSIYGDFIWIMIKATKFFNREEIPTKIIGVILDIDREKKSEMHLIQRANYDALTQIYKRETFIEALASEIESSRYKKNLSAVMFYDLDDFKHFNDEYGHACGDEVLKFVADTINELSFDRGFAGRFGGDEFVACFTNLTLYGDAGKIAQEVIDILGKGFISESTGMKLEIHCSIGIAFLNESGKTSEEVIAAADAAMYDIKKHGKSAFAYAKSSSQSPLDATGALAPGTSQIDSDEDMAAQ
ncbi:MAG: diguanylate cyclase [Oscillospiraceae bacterium]|nr:diguanylate cyclase [Oscillospiraceae bacterium]